MQNFRTCVLLLLLTKSKNLWNIDAIKKFHYRKKISLHIELESTVCTVSRGSLFICWFCGLNIGYNNTGYYNIGYFIFN